MTNDKGDRHVLAVAVHGGARIIVTWNRRHFPAASVQPYGIGVQDPDTFLVDLWGTNPHEMGAVLREQAAGLHRPVQTTAQVLETPGRTVPRFASLALASGLV
jgi:hypothetical protein